MIKNAVDSGDKLVNMFVFVFCSKQLRYLLMHVPRRGRYLGKHWLESIPGL